MSIGEITKRGSMSRLITDQVGDLTVNVSPAPPKRERR
jgi:hypothetical protein